MEEYLSKIKTQSEMKMVVEKAKGEGKKIVFTNGCFDILHQGHARYLSEAKKLGDYLIVGVNSDRSIKNIKGNNRPFMTEEARAELLAALCFVDGVVIFPEDDPLAIIKYLQPHVLVKGADWAEDKIIGAEFIKKTGGEVKRIPLIPNISTSDIIRRIIDLNSAENS
ncbi:MAG: D-glycero-beta-D-manno-heptose 1-phosphate adenylyltransferase [Deltaproteobacteria bacterium]|nr:D-glycero-beta-D-manno-heptose 1-phosphate adenylyltransferase [Deltaproteobacteria bacterium]HDH86427.1 D-glycero-beta-D-manno-heptose 1-phosphate adenylyltransferase [Desulfobacteraceae bacterium]MBW2105697.1 D-glycero-beta-D-manno-heptose 1-phosphate adenylyltransferase [Deltaproteobacteria bacterium]MBW2333089.1 D-glycero-beta-D-manno-heptose 1-phosphate adenylyltransferase [Deltaproteobacteria bacterium]MCD6266437.1 D-glycero-beta-D-manno-heptose 1-phosphate adenylyltransferase [Deltapr